MPVSEWKGDGTVTAGCFLTCWRMEQPGVGRQRGLTHKTEMHSHKHYLVHFSKKIVPEVFFFFPATDTACYTRPT